MIHARGYRPYHGARVPPGAPAVRAILQAGLRRPWKGRWFRLLLVLSQATTVVFGVLLWVQWRATDMTGGAMAGGGGVKLDGGDGARLFDPYWLLSTFLDAQLWGAALLVALMAGSEAIAADVRANAMPLYFSRPVSRMHYLAGKLLPVLVYLALVTLVPAFLLDVFRLSLSREGASVLAELPVLARLVAGCAIVTATLSCVVLACSAVGGRNWVARAAFLAAWLLPAAVAAVAAEVARLPWAAYVSPPHALRALLAVLLGQPRTLGPGGAAVSVALWTAGALAFVWWRLGRAAELR